jgi:hypothetical protein
MGFSIPFQFFCHGWRRRQREMIGHFNIAAPSGGSQGWASCSAPWKTRVFARSGLGHLDIHLTAPIGGPIVSAFGTQLFISTQLSDENIVVEFYYGKNEGFGFRETPLQAPPGKSRVWAGLPQRSPQWGSKSPIS